MAEIPADQRQDPTFLRTHQEQYGRDGCRVPLPWTREGSSFGFGAGGAHLPQPSWFADASVQAEEGDPASTLSLYRRALALRHELLALERLEWVETGRGDVLRFRRPNGWEVVTVFGSAPLALSFVPGQRVVLSSTPLDGDTVPGETTVWITGD